MFIALNSKTESCQAAILALSENLIAHTSPNIANSHGKHAMINSWSWRSGLFKDIKWQPDIQKGCQFGDSIVVHRFCQQICRIIQAMNFLNV